MRMGGDEAKGILAMRESGAHTNAQDEQGCTVFSLPKEAIKLGAAANVVSFPQIPGTILNVLRRTDGKAAAK